MLQYQPDGKHQQRLLSPSTTKLSRDAHWHEGCFPLVCRAMHCQCRCLRTSSIIIDRFTGTPPSDGQLCDSDFKLTELSGGHRYRWPREISGPNELSWNHIQLCMSNNLEIISGQSEQETKNSKSSHDYCHDKFNGAAVKRHKLLYLTLYKKMHFIYILQEESQENLFWLHWIWLVSLSGFVQTSQTGYLYDGGDWYSCVWPCLGCRTVHMKPSIYILI